VAGRVAASPVVAAVQTLGAVLAGADRTLAAGLAAAGRTSAAGLALAIDRILAAGPEQAAQ
jgi:uncharacterized transporter YbjL